MRFWNKTLVTLGSLASLTLALQAQTAIVYDNSANATGQFYGSTNEFGDQIKLAGNPLKRTITQFRFDYYLSHGVNGDEKATFRLYDNTGANGAPGNTLFESVEFSLAAGFQSVTIPMTVDVPDDITWTIQTAGITGSETFGLLMYNPPTVGSSFNDYWEKSGGTFQTKVFPSTSGTVANFGAQVIAVPEPGVIQLLCLGGFSWLGLVTYRRRVSK